jgi:replication factor A3
MRNYQGQTVRLPCKVIRISDDSAIVEASDGGHVSVKLSYDSTLGTVSYAEIIGKVTDAQTIDMMAAVDMGSDLDMDLVDGTIEMMHKHPQIFIS